MVVGVWRVACGVWYVLRECAVPTCSVSWCRLSALRSRGAAATACLSSVRAGPRPPSQPEHSMPIRTCGLVDGRGGGVRVRIGFRFRFRGMHNLLPPVPPPSPPPSPVRTSNRPAEDRVAHDAASSSPPSGAAATTPPSPSPAAAAPLPDSGAPGANLDGGGGCYFRVWAPHATTVDAVLRRCVGPRGKHPGCPPPPPPSPSPFPARTAPPLSSKGLFERAADLRAGPSPFAHPPMQILLALPIY